MTPAARRVAFDRSTLAFLAVLLIATGLRIWALQLSPLNLYYDEAQYWAWSRAFDWGYFSKPPMVAWAIGATTHFFGDGEWAVRLAAPIAQSLAALALFALGRSMYGAWAGFWAGVAWLAMPGVWFSANVISTDALLLPFWSFALFATWRLTQTRAWLWAGLLGAAIGVGLLAKYAMLYFFLGGALAAWWSLPIRQALKGGRGIAVLLIALLIFAPNLVWNAQHGFATAEHTASNVRLDPNDMFNIDKLVEFVTGQALLVGPILFAVLIWLLWRAVRHNNTLSDEDKFAIAFVVPPLALVTLVSFISRANANWAVTAYPAAIVWLSGNLTINAGRRRLFAAGLIANAAIGGVIAFGVLHPTGVSFVKGIRETSGWDETAREIALRAAPAAGELPFTAVLVDDRETFYELNYYWRQARAAGAPLPPLRMWLLHGSARSSAEEVDPMRAEDGRRVLVVHASPQYVPFVAGDFTTFRSVERLAIPLSANRSRNFEISVGEGFAPAVRDAAFEERARNAH